MKTIIDGARENLKQAIEGLDEAGIVDYAIIGGWCAYLNKQDRYHPGTIDVDILFRDANQPRYLETYINTMRNKEYFTSAKHQFQLLKVFSINEQKFCFNIDLLHTATGGQDDDLFVDQLDLNVLLNEEEQANIKMLSIVQKESRVVFEEKMYNSMDIGDGYKANIIDYTGMFITKTKSCQKEKRDRDSYDIFLGFENNLIDIKRLKKICNEYPPIGMHVKSFLDFINKEESIALFNNRVKKYRQDIAIIPTDYINSKLKEFA